jgi:DNA polymerase elongation subunit (family B)
MVGHHVHYVVCVHKDSSNLADKAFSPKEFLNDKKEIDFEYYKN